MATGTRGGPVYNCLQEILDPFGTALPRLYGP